MHRGAAQRSRSRETAQHSMLATVIKNGEGNNLKELSARLNHVYVLLVGHKLCGVGRLCWAQGNLLRDHQDTIV